MEIKILKLHDDAVIPSYATKGDAGLDLTATEVGPNGDIWECKTGLAVEIPRGYVGLVYPRSSVRNKQLSLSNSVGVIDSGYRGEIIVNFRIVDFSKASKDALYAAGDKVAQLMIVPYPQITFNEVSTLEESDRGEKGFGSTGK